MSDGVRERKPSESGIDSTTDGISRRSFLGRGSAALAFTAGLPIIGAAQQVKDMSGDNHAGKNETEIGPINKSEEAANPDSVYPPTTDSGGQPPFKYPFAYAHRRVEAGGWTRQVTVRELPVSKKMAGVEMRLLPGAVRELHWHVPAEWAFMVSGKARITAVDAKGRGFVEDVTPRDLWLFPGGIPHSIQGLPPDGCQFLLVFNDGNFNEFDTFLLTDWMHHTPAEVLAKNFNVPPATFDKVPERELFIFNAELPRTLEEEKKEVYAVADRCRTPTPSSPTRCSRIR